MSDTVNPTTTSDDALKHRSRPSAIVGLFFLAFDGKTQPGLPGDIKWQGKVVAREDDNTYLVRLHSWIDGRATYIKIVNQAEMHNWQYYDNVEAWQNDSAMHAQLVVDRQRGKTANRPIQFIKVDNA